MQSPPESKQYRWIVLGVLCGVYVLNFLDRQLLSILAEPIKQDLSLSDTQLGLLGGSVFAIFYSVCALPIARLADQGNRVRIVAVSCFLWSLFSAACGRALSFGQLALARMGVAVGEAGGAPPSYSIISDYFDARHRGLALGIFSLGVPLGLGLGSLTGASLAAAYGWRQAFYAVGALGVVLALVAARVIREPRRGRLDGYESPSAAPRTTSMRQSAVLFFRTPVLRSTALAGGASAFVYYGMLNWSVPFLMREKGLSLHKVALYFSPVLTVSMGLGMCASGWLIDRYARKNPERHALIPAAAFTAALPFYLGFLFAPSWGWSVACQAVAGLLSIMYLTCALSLVQNTAAPQHRTTFAALLLLVINLAGLGAGPLFVGQLSDLAQARHSAHPLLVALLCLAPVHGLAALMHLLTARALSTSNEASTHIQYGGPGPLITPEPGA